VFLLDKAIHLCICCRQHKAQVLDADYCDGCICLSVCLSVCVFVMSVSRAKMAEPIEMPFGELICVGRRNCVLDWGYSWAPSSEYSWTIRAQRWCGLSLPLLLQLVTTSGRGSYKKIKKRIALSATSTAPLRELVCHMGSRSVTCHPAKVTFPLLPQPIKAGTRFIDPMQGWVDLVGLVTYQGGIPAQRRLPIPVLTELNVEQLRSYDERRYHGAKPHSQHIWVQCVSRELYIIPYLRITRSTENWDLHIILLTRST